MRLRGWVLSMTCLLGVAVGNQPAQSQRENHSAEFRAMQQKIAYLKENGAKAHPDPKPVELTEPEVNAFFNEAFFAAFLTDFFFAAFFGAFLTAFLAGAFFAAFLAGAFFAAFFAGAAFFAAAGFFFGASLRTGVLTGTTDSLVAGT